MTKYAFAVLAALFAWAGATSADARPSRDAAYEWNPFVQPSSSVAQSRGDHRAERRATRERGASRGRAARLRQARSQETSYSNPSRGPYNAGPRPGRWCGWWMRTQRGGGAHLNVAWNWRKWGRPASGPQVGAVVVWRGHVGEIVGRASNGQWLVRSGNDGGKVRTRARSVAGAVFRVG